MSGLIGGSIGFGLPIILRLELALPGFIPCPPLQYNSNITFHGIFMTSSMIMRYFLILLGFRYLASSIPSISLAGVAIGVGFILCFLQIILFILWNSLFLYSYLVIIDIL